jgi:hypothetical protein
MGDHPPPGRGHLVAITSRASTACAGGGRSAITSAKRRTVSVAAGPGGIDVTRAGCWRCLGYGGQGRTLHRGLPGGRTLGRSSAAGFPVGAGSPMSSWGNVLAAHATTGPQRSQILELLTSFRDLSLRAALTASARERRRRIRRQGRRAFRPRRRARGKGRSTTTRRAIRATQRVTRGVPPGPRRADRRARDPGRRPGRTLPRGSEPPWSAPPPEPRRSRMPG